MNTISEDIKKIMLAGIGADLAMLKAHIEELEKGMENEQSE